MTNQPANFTDGQLSLMLRPYEYRWLLLPMQKG